MECGVGEKVVVKWGYEERHGRQYYSCHDYCFGRGECGVVFDGVVEEIKAGERASVWVIPR